VRASLAFRKYLAERDVFVRDAARSVWEMRALLAHGRSAAAGRILHRAAAAATRFSREIQAGRDAARLMWRRTRDPRATGPNERVTIDDAARLRAWRAWLGECENKTASVARESSPVAGAWQVVFTVINFAPAVQKVVLEQWGPEGRWRDVHGLFLVEFQAAAARPRAKRTVQFSAPIAWSGTPTALPRLQIAARGFGQFKVRDLVLTDGVERYVPYRGERRAVALGRPAPSAGFPDFDWQEDRDVWGIAWRKNRRLLISRV
jgi:hypothetical protein